MDTRKLIENIDEELIRSKLMLNANGYHHGTAISQIVRRYRSELKEYRKIVSDDLNIDQVNFYDTVDN